MARNNNETPVVFRDVDLSAEVKKLWGPEWSKPETSYVFSNGRKFELQTGDAAIYATSPSF